MSGQAIPAMIKLAAKKKLLSILMKKLVGAGPSGGQNLCPKGQTPVVKSTGKKVFAQHDPGHRQFIVTDRLYGELFMDF